MSYQRKSIKIDDLLLNPENFRFDPVKSQNEAMKIMMQQEKEKIKNLAQHIARYGLSPIETLLVTKTDKGKYLVHEGNRRLTAIKLIYNPKIIPLDEQTQFFSKI